MSKSKRITKLNIMKKLILLLAILSIGCDKQENEDYDCPCTEVYVTDNNGDFTNNRAVLVPLRVCIIEWDYEVITSLGGDRDVPGINLYSVKESRALELSREQDCF